MLLICQLFSVAFYNIDHNKFLGPFLDQEAWLAVVLVISGGYVSDSGAEELLLNPLGFVM